MAEICFRWAYIAALGTLLSSLYISKRISVQRLLRSKLFLFGLYIPVAIAFASVYLGAYIDYTSESEFLAKHFPSLPKYFGLSALSARFGFVTYLVAFTTMIALATRILAGAGRNVVIVFLVVCAPVAYWRNSSGAYPIRPLPDRYMEGFLKEQEFNNKLGTDKILEVRGIKKLPEAFAQWLSTRLESNRKYWEELAWVDSRWSFPSSLSRRKEAGSMPHHAALALARLQDSCASFRNHISQ